MCSNRLSIENYNFLVFIPWLVLTFSKYELNISFCIFQEFSQTKAIDLQALIGNVGGYIGLVFGTSLISTLPYIKKTFKWIETKRMGRCSSSCNGN